MMAKRKRESWVSSGVQRRRAAKQWSRRELAERAGVAESTIANIEYGFVMPSVDTLEPVLRALGCELGITEIEYDWD
jgi:transcriptional regulator with XRE-family HTH domain